MKIFTDADDSEFTIQAWDHPTRVVIKIMENNVFLGCVAMTKEESASLARHLLAISGEYDV